MDSARWERIQTLFHAALERPPEDRDAFLERGCDGDDELLSDVSKLLGEDQREGSLLDRALEGVAHDVLSDVPPPIESIGPYRLIRLLGEGGMGVVYLAERTDLDQHVAIKLLRDATLSPGRRERFQAEQRTLAQLDHPSIVRIYDADVLPDGTPYFVMEHVEGEPLGQFCNTHRLSIPDRLRLFRDVCEAVQEAHRLGIIHRDLKPSNILVTETGLPKLLDFGISKQLDDGEASATQTQTALRVLTPAYAAPEQIRGEPVGVHTDIYALGVVLYELLTDSRPHDVTGLSSAEIERRILEHEPEKPSARTRRATERVDGAPSASDVSKAGWRELDVICLTAMHRDPERRYNTVDAFRRDLLRYEGGQPLEARPDTLGYRVDKFLRRNRAAVTVGAAILSTIAGLVIFYTAQLSQARDEALAEAARTQRIQQFTLNLFSGGDDHAGPADSLRVVTLLERGVIEAGSLARDPEIQAEVFGTLGGLFQGLGELDRADSLLTAALDRSRELFGSDGPEVANAMVALGLLRTEQAELEEAETLVRGAFEMAGRYLPPEHTTVIRAQTALGYVLQSRGEYEEAIEVLEDVTRREPSGEGAALELHEGLSELANTYYYAGDFVAFDSLNQKLLAANRIAYGTRHPSVADNLMNVGAVQFQWGQYAVAESAYREALDIFESYFGAEHPQVASGLTALGRSLLYQQRTEEAVDLLDRALAIREAVYGPVHPDVATTRNDIGTVALQRGDLDAAQAQYERVTDIYRVVYGDDHYYIGIALSNVASVHLEREDYATAELVFREVIDIFARELSATHLQTAVAQIKLGRALVRQGKYREAEEHSRTGHDALLAQTDPAISWISAARTDLIAAYEALGQPAKAAALRAQQDSASAARP